VTWNKVVTEDKSMHMKDFFADKIGADTSKLLSLAGRAIRIVVQQSHVQKLSNFACSFVTKRQ